MGAGATARPRTDVEDDDASDAGLETTGGKFLIGPGATIPLRDDAAEDDLLELSSKRSSIGLVAGSL